MSSLDEQTKLLYHSDYLYFVRVDPDGQWEFGRRLEMESYIALQLMSERSLTETVDVYHRLMLDHHIPAWVYRSDVIGREFRLVPVHEVLPISEALFREVAAAHYDLLRAPAAVVDQLQEVIDQFNTGNRG